MKISLNTTINNTIHVFIEGNSSKDCIKQLNDIVKGCSELLTSQQPQEITVETQQPTVSTKKKTNKSALVPNTLVNE